MRAAPWRRARRPIALAGLVLAGAGCGGVWGSNDLAPNGLHRQEEALRRLVATGRADTALARVAPGADAAPDDELLRSLYAGILAYHAGAYEESAAALQRAADLAEDRYTKRISRAALSLATNDKVLPYEPGPTERLLIHHYAALGYLRRGDLNGAVVEARRIAFLLDRERGSEEEARSRELRAVLRHLTGAIFEAAGERNDAAVAYRNAAALRGVDPKAVEDALPPPLPDTLGEVVVVVERGFVAHRVEQAVVVPIGGATARAIARGEGEERAALAAEIAARIVAAAAWRHGTHPRLYDRRPSTLHIDIPDRPRRCAEEDEDEEEEDGGQENGKDRNRRKCEGLDIPYILKVAWPVFRQDRAPAPGAELVAAEKKEPVRLQASVSEAVAADFEAERTLVLARTIARAATKFGVTRGVAETVADQNEGLGALLGVLTNLGTALLEQADTRSWQLLPARLGVARLRLPPGTHELELRTGGPDGARRIELGEVEVAAGRFTFLAARTWR